MVRVLATAVVLTLLIPHGTIAAGDGPPGWPSTYELRRELQRIGYEFGYDGNWDGGRMPAAQDGLPEPDAPVIQITEGIDGPLILLTADPDDLDAGWPASRYTAYTALMEVMEILPADPETRDALMVSFGPWSDSDGCWRLPIGDGARAMFQRRHADDPWNVRIGSNTYDKSEMGPCEEPDVHVVEVVYR